MLLKKFALLLVKLLISTNNYMGIFTSQFNCKVKMNDFGQVFLLNCYYSC